MSGGGGLCSVDFEIFGHVQGRYSYTEREGLKLGLVGWVKNTNKGTVVGQVQGPEDQVREIKEGSPSSRITRAVFTNEHDIPRLEISGFVVIKCKW
uniref:Acylphosphatase-like domain-containing protein n=1 Tax=Denticeps clupeoides TaxID=299321 RepID=A0AAY4BKB6_9TELE